MTRRDGLLLALLLVIQGILVQGVFVTAPHPGGDNAAYVALGHSLHSGQGYTELWDPAAPPHTKYPPLFPVLLAAAMTLGATGWVGLKLVPALLALVAVAGTFLWARRRLGTPAGFGVALLTGLSPSLLYHSHWVLSDVPFLAFTVLALWWLDGRGEGRGSSEESPEPGSVPGRGAVVVGALCVLLAYLTRSAGLPLVVAAVGALALQGRRRRALGVAAGVGVPALWWALRGRAAAPGQGRYGSEFLLLDPYQPDLGTAGVVDFARRVVENLTGYGTRFVPEALVGGVGGLPLLLGAGVVVLAVVGWLRAVRRGPGVTEAFVPLYLGLILLWPPVWSGDRFALPLIPPLLLLALEGVRSVPVRVGEAARGWILVGLGLAVGTLALQDWFEARVEREACGRAVAAAGPWACGGRPLVDFVAAAEWAGESLPEGSAVLTRKPRIWYLMSGLPSRTYPFTEREGHLFEAAREAGAGFVLLDYVGAQGPRFVGAALARAPERFCQLGVFGGEERVPPSRLLRMLDPGSGQGSRGEEGQVRLSNCPPPPEPTVQVRTGDAGASGIPLLLRP